MSAAVQQHHLLLKNDTLRFQSFVVTGIEGDVKLAANTSIALTPGPNTTTFTVGTMVDDQPLTVNYDNTPTSIWYEGTKTLTYQLVADYNPEPASTKTTVTFSGMATLYNDLKIVPVVFTVDGETQKPLYATQFRAMSLPTKSVVARFTIPENPIPFSSASAPAPASASASASPSILAAANSPSASPSAAFETVVLEIAAFNGIPQSISKAGAKLSSERDEATGAVSYRVSIVDPSSNLAIIASRRNDEARSPIHPLIHPIHPITIAAFTLAAVFYVLFVVFLGLYLYVEK
jgi:hypothetical protein